MSALFVLFFLLIHLMEKIHPPSNAHYKLTNIVGLTSIENAIACTRTT